MPGTIQVTVLEFKGVASSSKPPAKSLKVSMGKRQFQTWDKGDFSFPIAKLGEDLVVTLLDAGGNEIAHEVIQTMQIIQKGYWDEVFSINGGGHVHMKLQFLLSEEERHRIRIMRESAMKKKLETNPNIKLKISEVSGSVETWTKNEQKVSGFTDIDEVSHKVDASQAGNSSLASATTSAILSSLHEDGGIIPESAIPVKELSDATGGSQGAPSSPGKHEIKSESPQKQETVPFETIETQSLANIRSVDTGEGRPSSMLSESPTPNKNNAVASKLQDDHPPQKSQNQDSVEKTPSNVRKMISAFENSQIQNMAHMESKQDVKSLKKASSVPSQLNRLREGGLSEDQESKADKSLTDFKDHFAETVPSDHGSSHSPKELSSTLTPVQSGGDDHQKSPVDLARQSTSETATSSGRMPEEQTQGTQPYNLSSKSISSTESSVAEGRGTGLKSSTMMVASNKKLTLDYYEEECYSGQSSGMWIFPDNKRRLCITTAGKQVVKIVGHRQNEFKTHKVKKISSESENVMHEIELRTEKNQKKIVDEPKSGSGSFPDDSSNGLVGQVIKIAVIIGFGVLVLLTRQKEPRKKHRRKC